MVDSNKDRMTPLEKLAFNSEYAMRNSAVESNENASGASFDVNSIIPADQRAYIAMPDLLGTVSWFHADGEYYRTREFYVRTRPLTHHSTHTSIVQKTDEDYAVCVEFVKANDYYMTGDPGQIACPYCDGFGSHKDGYDSEKVECGKCKGTGMVEAD